MPTIDTVGVVPGGHTITGLTLSRTKEEVYVFTDQATSNAYRMSAGGTFTAGAAIGTAVNRAIRSGSGDWSYVSSNGALVKWLNTGATSYDVRRVTSPQRVMAAGYASLGIPVPPVVVGATDIVLGSSLQVWHFTQATGLWTRSGYGTLPLSTRDGFSNAHVAVSPVAPQSWIKWNDPVQCDVNATTGAITIQGTATTPLWRTDDAGGHWYPVNATFPTPSSGTRPSFADTRQLVGVWGGDGTCYVAGWGLGAGDPTNSTLYPQLMSAKVLGAGGGAFTASLASIQLIGAASVNPNIVAWAPGAGEQVVLAYTEIGTGTHLGFVDSHGYNSVVANTTVTFGANVTFLASGPRGGSEAVAFAGTTLLYARDYRVASSWRSLGTSAWGTKAAYAQGAWQFYDDAGVVHTVTGLGTGGQTVTSRTVLSGAGVHQLSNGYRSDTQHRTNIVMGTTPGSTASTDHSFHVITPTAVTYLAGPEGDIGTGGSVAATAGIQSGELFSYSVSGWEPFTP